MPKKSKIAVAISGGCDSAAAALILKRAGSECMGVFMDIGFSKRDDEDAAKGVCEALDMPFKKIVLKKPFKDLVVSYFIESYKKGLTPNPCVRCNQKIKFSELMQASSKLGADMFATGHYVRKAESKALCEKKAEEEMADKNTKFELMRAMDKNKDQSYFLYTLTQRQLKGAIFPLGRVLKTDARLMVEAEGIPYLKKESQDICFLTEKGKSHDHNDFLMRYIKRSPGAIMTLSGKVVGEHKGLPFYTIGQRRGIEIGGIGPFYACGMDRRKNILFVADKFDDQHLYSKKLVCDKLHWISGKQPPSPIKCQAVIRYRHKEENCIVIPGQNSAEVIFTKKQRAITPGQSIVLYQKDRMLGGAVIRRACISE